MTLAATTVTGAPQAAALPWQLPKTQAEWQAFLNALNSWSPQAPAWQAITLQNSWTAQGAPYASPQWQVDKFGRVSCRGLIKSGTVTDGTVIATLPLPPSAEIAISPLANSGSGYAPIRLDVATTGNILLYGASGFSGSYFISLDQLSFSLAQ